MNVRNNNIMYKNMMLANRQEVNYVQQGEGQPVILTHGLAASLHDWDDLMPELSGSGYAGYALDLFGHGESHKPADHSEYTVEAVFDHFSSWIESLQIREPMTLIGHSLGGGLSLLYAMRYPERVRALVLINPFYDIGQLPHILQTVFRRQLLNTYLMDLTPYRLFRMIVDVTSFNEYIGDRERHSLPEHIRYQTAMDYTRASSGIYKLPSTLPLMKPNHASDPAESLSQINQPTLLLWGERDQTLAPASFPQLAKMLPNLTGTHILPSCGHVPHQCHPETFNPHVMKFLANL